MGRAKAKNESFADFLNELKSNAVVNPKPVAKIEERRYFLIVCEGERTEPNYFNYFKNFLPKHLVETINVKGEGDNTINIVNKAISLRNIRKNDVLLPDYDEVWAIYDKDDFPATRYNSAIRLARRENIESGHSNQSFELWYILHFEFLQNALHRSDYITKLSKILQFKYKKNDLKAVKALFEKGNVRRAITWAKALEAMHVGSTPANSCPYTRVYVLVERLLKFTKKEA
ncbi:MAG: abortive phage infection protein [Chitinophaga sp.]|nr:abortive phage infection protein [Chitinophaga sp.]